MTARLDGPELVINYDPALDLRITCISALAYPGISLPEYFFEVDCCLRHPTGRFSYFGNKLCFDVQSFAQFAEQLREIQQGLRQEAALRNVGEMMVLRLEGTSRRLRAKVQIREYMAPSTAALSATLEVEYDLFVNKLREEIDRFVEELERVEPTVDE
jgi:hypothetical protein